jgi:membrane protease YdiL (CAAX protease family)
VATFAFSLVIALAFVSVQTALAIPYLLIQLATTPHGDVMAVATSMQTDGLFFALAEALGAIFAVSLIVLIVWLRRGPPLGEYLALRPAPVTTLLRWLLGTAVLAGALEATSWLAGTKSTPDWMLGVYRSARFLPLLLFAVLVVAPILEELLFRGFLFEGLRRSPLGDAGTTVLASLLWACAHLQYSWFFIAQIFVLGLLLGAARAASRSLLVPILMHAFFSAIAMLQMALEYGPS